MNLAKMKELEDLKVQYDEKSKQHGNMIIARKTSYLKQATSEFKEFFQEKGFSIHALSNVAGVIKANYNTIEVNMAVPKVDDCFWGAYSILDLIISSPQKKEYSVLLNEMNYYPSVKSTITTLPRNQSEDEKIEVEIKSLLKKIEEVDKDIKEFYELKWGFGLINKNEKGFDYKYPQFESIKELLNSLFQ